MGELVPDDNEQDFVWSHGLRFPNAPDILSQQHFNALKNNHFERWEHRAVAKLATNQDNVLELGGGFGFLSSVMAVKCNVNAVTTLEPNPALAKYIAQVHHLNGVKNAEVIEAIAGPTALEKIPFHIRRNLLASSLDDDIGKKPVRTIDVKSIDINRLIQEYEISYIVCDIEGGEADLIDFLEPGQLRAITIELHPNKISNDGVRSIFEKLHENGLVYSTDASFGKVVSFVRDTRTLNAP